MKKHTKIYFEGMGFDEMDFIPCEVCSKRATDIHHIDARGMGGDPQGKKDTLENLMALCRVCHDNFGDIVDFKPYLRKIHNMNIETRG